MANNLLRITELVLTFLETVIQSGDTVIDATAGNGNDTLMLTKMVGKTGRVLAFDIQEKAIEKTGQLLQEAGLLEGVRLIRDDHACFDKYLQQEKIESIKAMTVNLGYLPGDSHKVVTKVATSLELLNKSLLFLEAGGMITVCLYPGHPEGQKEALAVLEWAKKLEGPFISHHFQTLNRKQPPELLIVQKKRTS